MPLRGGLLALAQAARPDDHADLAEIALIQARRESAHRLDGLGGHRGQRNEREDARPGHPPQRDGQRVLGRPVPADDDALVQLGALARERERAIGRCAATSAGRFARTRSISISGGGLASPNAPRCRACDQRGAPACEAAMARRTRRAKARRRQTASSIAAEDEPQRRRERFERRRGVAEVRRVRPARRGPRRPSRVGLPSPGRKLHRGAASGPPPGLPSRAPEPRDARLDNEAWTA